MTVGELIKKLEEFDKNDEAYIRINGPFGAIYEPLLTIMNEGTGPELIFEQSNMSAEDITSKTFGGG